jgi:O-antigen ligase
VSVIARFTRGQWSGFAIAVTVLLAFAFLFGGASRQNELRVALVELAALPVLIMCLPRASEGFRDSRLTLGLLCGLALIPLVQLLPLPPGLWTSMPGRAELVLALDLAEVPQGWTTWSLTPDRTWRSLLALIPPIAMFIGMMTVRPEDRLRCIQFVLIATAGFVVLGALQLASGGERYYPWRTTDAGSVVGLFANRNHLATLCLVALPFTTMFAGRAVRRNGPGDRMTLWAATLLTASLVVAVAVIRSRAGLALFIPVLGLSLVATWFAAGKGKPPLALIAVVGAVSVAMTAVVIFALAPIVSRFDQSGIREARFENWPTVYQVAETFLPSGSGVGSFDAVYRSVEPLEKLDPTFFNQAHNDYLELWLETGLFGAILFAVFLFWFARRSWAAWRGGGSTERSLQRSASIAILAVLLHSGIDYPLRTLTIAVVFAMCCAILEMAGRPEAEQMTQRRRQRRSRSS